MKTEWLQIRISPILKKRVEQLAIKQGKSISEVARSLLEIEANKLK